MGQEPGRETNDGSARCPAGAWRGALPGAGVAAILHLHLLGTPYWQDDYVGLANAYARREVFHFGSVGREAAFLRPVSVDGWWYVMTQFGFPWPETTFLVKLGLFTVAVTLVGVLASWLAARRLLDTNGGHARKRAFWAALLYGAHNAFFLPLAWGSGAQEILGLLFSASALLGWMAWCTREDRKRWLFLGWGVLMQLLAHGSKEGTLALVVSVPLMLWLARARWSQVFVAFLMTIILADVWMEIRSQHVTPPGPGSPYEYVLGLNMARNGAALLAFAAGLPREAVQLFILHRDPWALAWGSGCLLLFSAGAALVLRGLDRRQAVIMAAAPTMMFALSLAPYVPLRWNCYPYYALFGLMAWPVLVALSWSEGRRIRIAGALIVSSTLYCALGQHWAPYPSTLARARRAGELMQRLKDAGAAQSKPVILTVVGDADSPAYAEMGWLKGTMLWVRPAYGFGHREHFDVSGAPGSGVYFVESDSAPARRTWESLRKGMNGEQIYNAPEHLAVHFRGTRMRIGRLYRPDLVSLPRNPPESGPWTIPGGIEIRNPEVGPLILGGPPPGPDAPSARPAEVPPPPP